MYPFAVVRYSPMPEVLEPANVALLLPKGRGSRLDWLDTFPRLSCMVHGVNLGLVRGALEHLSGLVSEMDVTEALAEISRSNRRTRVAGPYQAASLDERTLTVLRRTYLEHGSVVNASQRDSVKRAFEQRVDRYLAAAGVGSAKNTLRRASAAKFLTPRAAEVVGSVKFARVVSGSDKIVLIQPIDLVSSSDQVKRLSDFKFSFHQIAKARQFENRSLVRALMVMRQAEWAESTKDPSRFDFAIEDCATKADVVYRPGINDEEFKHVARVATLV